VKEVIDVLMLGGFVLFMIFVLKGFTKQQMQKHLDKNNQKNKLDT